MKHLITVFLSFHFTYLFSWDVLSKLLLIIVTSGVVIWDEVRKRFSSKESTPEKRRNRIYVFTLLVILIGSLVNETASTINTKEGEAKTENRLKGLSASEKSLQSNLKITMDTAGNTIDSLNVLLRKTEGVKIQQEKLLAASIIENQLINTAIGNLKYFSEETKKTLPKISNPINAITFNTVLEVDSFSFRYPKLYALIKSSGKGDDFILLNQVPAVFTNTSFANFKFIIGTFKILPYPVRKTVANITVKDLKSENIELGYGMLSFADSSIFSAYKTGSIAALQEYPISIINSSFSPIIYQFFLKSNRLLINCVENMSYKMENKLTINSPLDFQDKEILNKHFCFVRFFLNDIKNLDFSKNVSIKIVSFSMTFNHNSNQRYEFNGLKKVDDNVFIGPLDFKF